MSDESKPADIVERASKAASAFARASESESIHSALLLNASEIIDVLCDEIELLRFELAKREGELLAERIERHAEPAPRTLSTMPDPPEGSQ